jgi:methionine-rich copper-binding protein CopC
MWFSRALTVIVSLFFLVSHASAHAILVESSPAAHSTVNGQSVPLVLKFNSRIDASRSRLVLIVGSGPEQPLKVNEASSTDRLTANVSDLRPGNYRVRWQVLAVDGHVTRGELEFEVKQ